MARQRPEARRSDDAGFSLIEVMVTMTVMSIVMVIFTGAILQIYRTTKATESLTTAQTQLRLAFQRFDRELRYASWVAEPGQFGSAWYVEFAGPADSGCQQLRLETEPEGTEASGGSGVLQLLQWTPGSPPPVDEPGQTIASQIVTTGVAPFFDLQSINELPYASASADAVGTEFTTAFQRLRIRLTTKVAAGTSQIDTTFTALNSTRAGSATNACSEGRPR